VHANIIGHLKNEMPILIGKDSKQAELIANLPMEFKRVHKNGLLPAGDFPEIEKFREHLKLYDFSKFPKYSILSLRFSVCLPLSFFFFFFLIFLIPKAARFVR
jgi:hypothetical protein